MSRRGGSLLGEAGEMFWAKELELPLGHRLAHLMEKPAHRRRPSYLKLQLPDQPPPKITASDQLSK
jgi:hypothetical protein